MRSSYMLSATLLASCQLATSGLVTGPKVSGGGGSTASSTSAATATARADDAPAGEVAGDTAASTSVDGFRYVPGVRSPTPDHYLINLAVPPAPDYNGAYCPFRSMDAPEADPEVPVPDLVGLSLQEAIDKLASLERYCLRVTRTDCTAPGGAEHVCFQSAPADSEIRVTQWLALELQTDVIYEGTADEMRRLPDIQDQPLDASVAALARAGFKNVKVVEDKSPCEPGIVCSTNLRPDFYPPAIEVVIYVRAGRR